MSINKRSKMNATKLWLLALPLLVSAATQAADSHGGGDWGQRGAEPARAHRDEGPRGDSGIRHDDRAANNDSGRRDENRHDENRHENRRDDGRDDGRHNENGRGDNHRGDGRSEPPRIWSSPPRMDDHDRGDASRWNRSTWRDGRGDHNSYGYYRSPNYNFYRDYARDQGYGRSYNRYDDGNQGRGYGSYYGNYYGNYGSGHYDNRRWRRGERLPFAYLARDRWEPEYWRYDLYDPRDGCGWVRSDGDALLVVLATGLVLDAVYDIYR